jgi:hypothetical protein
VPTSLAACRSSRSGPRDPQVWGRCADLSQSVSTKPLLRLRQGGAPTRAAQAPVARSPAYACDVGAESRGSPARGPGTSWSCQCVDHARHLLPRRPDMQAIAAAQVAALAIGEQGIAHSRESSRDHSCDHRHLDSTSATPHGPLTCRNVADGWRWRWDLNPRTACTVTRFRGVLLRPLGHATAAEITGRRAGPGKTPAAAQRTRRPAPRRRPRGDG